MRHIKENLLIISNKLRNYEAEYQRARHAVFLLAVSKGQSIKKILAAISEGQLAFGENYLQEALAKINQLVCPGIEWHFIGHIQSNKTRAIAENFAWVHTVYSEKIAQRLNEQRPSILPPLNICLEVNVNKEGNKSGLIEPKEILTLARSCMHLPKLRLRGLMAIPAQTNIFSEQRANFHQLRLLQQMLKDNGIEVDTLSMGMSGDFEAAIAEGSTIVRIGRGIFGGRG